MIILPLLTTAFLAMILPAASGQILGTLPLLGSLPPPTGLVSCLQTTNPNPDVNLTIPQVLQKYGYPVQNINVTTEDGYILTVFRIPSSPASPLVPGQIKKAVYLNHGMLANGGCWVVQYRDENLAMLLADSGLDVFIGNARGTSYSQGHVNLSTTDTKYWDFSWHEMGIWDVPAVVDMILSVTGNTQVSYVGHSMGTTQLMVLLSEKPQYNQKIAASFLLAVAGALGNSPSVLRTVAPLAYHSQYLLNPILGGKISATQQLQQYTGQPLTCNIPAATCALCENLLYCMHSLDMTNNKQTRNSKQK